LILGKRLRVDDLLCARGLAQTLAEARALVMAGQVYRGLQRIDKPSELVTAGDVLEVRGRRRYVSRGGTKLERALEHFKIECNGAVCLDAGCSSGGFTDCLLQHGASRVYAIDVGYGQIDWGLRNDRRVVLFERTNLRDVTADDLDPLPTIVVADLSFIGLVKVMPTLVGLCAPEATLVLLVKPQFELARGETTGGVVRDPALHAKAIAMVDEAARVSGLRVLGSVESPLRGPRGNSEFLVAYRTA